MLEIEEQEFYVKYARPFFGRISNGTEVKIDSSTPKRVQILRVAPIWTSDEKHEECVRNKCTTFQHLKETYLNPYFLCGFMCHIEKGETLMIDT